MPKQRYTYPQYGDKKAMLDMGPLLGWGAFKEYARHHVKTSADIGRTHLKNTVSSSHSNLIRKRYSGVNHKTDNASANIGEAPLQNGLDNFREVKSVNIPTSSTMARTHYDTLGNIEHRGEITFRTTDPVSGSTHGISHAEHTHRTSGSGRVNAMKNAHHAIFLKRRNHSEQAKAPKVLRNIMPDKAQY